MLPTAKSMLNAPAGASGLKRAAGAQGITGLPATIRTKLSPSASWRPTGMGAGFARCVIKYAHVNSLTALTVCGPLQISSEAFAKIGVNVVALTRANFSAATLREDALLSSYTRCESVVAADERD